MAPETGSEHPVEGLIDDYLASGSAAGTSSGAQGPSASRSALRRRFSPPAVAAEAAPRAAPPR